MKVAVRLVIKVTTDTNKQKQGESLNEIANKQKRQVIQTLVLWPTVLINKQRNRKSFPLLRLTSKPLN